jgi:hypothetical protein
MHHIVMTSSEGRRTFGTLRCDPPRKPFPCGLTISNDVLWNTEIEAYWLQQHRRLRCPIRRHSLHLRGRTCFLFVRLFSKFLVGFTASFRGYLELSTCGCLVCVTVPPTVGLIRPLLCSCLNILAQHFIYRRIDINEFYSLWLYVSQNKQRLFPGTTLTDDFTITETGCLQRGTDWFFNF